MSFNRKLKFEITDIKIEVYSEILEIDPHRCAYIVRTTEVYITVAVDIRS